MDHFLLQSPSAQRLFDIQMMLITAGSTRYPSVYLIADIDMKLLDLGDPVRTVHSTSSVVATVPIYRQASIDDRRDLIEWEFQNQETSMMGGLSEILSYLRSPSPYETYADQQAMLESTLASRCRLFLRQERWVSSLLRSLELPTSSVQEAQALCQNVVGQTTVRKVLLNLFFKLLFLNYVEPGNYHPEPELLANFWLEAQRCYLRTLQNWILEAWDQFLRTNFATA